MVSLSTDLKPLLFSVFAILFVETYAPIEEQRNSINAINSASLRIS